MTADNPKLAALRAAIHANEHRKGAARCERAGAHGMAAELRTIARQWLATARYLKAMV